MKPGLHLDNVSLHIGERLLFPPMTFEVAEGEIVTVMGQSGCGKSSLLSWMCGTLPRVFTATGSIFINGTDITEYPAELRRLGILFQDDLLFPHLSVAQNLAFALPSAVTGRKARRDRIELALREAGLEGFADRDPATLSGGQRSRAAVIRVLLSEPRALLLDEPFSKLDQSTRQRFRDFVFDFLRGRQLPTLMVTHDPADASATGGRVIQLQE